MVLVRGALALAVAAWLGACSGSTTPTGPTFTVSGTVRAAPGTDVDGDTAASGAAAVHNDAYATAQALPAVVTLGGWASQALDGHDWYRATVAAGQVVTLEIADWAQNDLDLCAYAAGTPPVLVACSQGSGATESWTAPSAGEYALDVRAYAGASSYVLSLALAPLAAPPPDPGALRLDAEFVPGEVVVRFRNPAGPGPAARAQALGLEAVSGAEGREVLMRLGGGAARARAFSALGVPEHARDLAAEVADPVLAAKADTLAVVKALRRRADVATADPNYVLHPTLAPNDQHYPKQWHYPFIGLTAAWDTTTGAPPSGDVVVAVVDTGVFLAHPDLAPKLVAGYDFVSSAGMSNDGDGIDPDPDDPGDEPLVQASSFHGTHVAGTVGAATDNGTGVAGVSWAAKIMPVRVLGVGGGTSADLIQAVRFAAGLPNDSNTVPAKPADVINLSLGCTACFSGTEQAAFDEVRAAGVIVVAAAGNEGTAAPGYPASYAGVVSVSAVDRNGNRAPYSSFGSAVDVAAPGGWFTGETDAANGIASTWADASSGTRTAAYAYMAGTSMAAPHVAGVVALMKAQCPALQPAQLDAMLSTGGLTVDKGTIGRDDVFGWGIVDAAKAVVTAAGGCTLVTALEASPGRLDFAPERVALGLALSKHGAGALPAVTAADDASWLALSPPASADGLGTWTATVTRGSLAPGAYSATVTFTAGASTLAVPVLLQVGGSGGAPGNAGPVMVQLRSAGGTILRQVSVGPSAGAYAYTFPGVTAGSYRVVAGTDLDGDGLGCADAGEACGAYPTRAAPADVDVAADVAGLDFGLGFDVALGAAGGEGIR